MQTAGSLILLTIGIENCLFPSGDFSPVTVQEPFKIRIQVTTRTHFHGPEEDEGGPEMVQFLLVYVWVPRESKVKPYYLSG